ncbi:Pyruvate phosphate dikinase 1 chloroplastic [Bienertia sinuspersici]
MAAGWMKSLQCKSRVVEDVFQPHSKQLLTSTSCRNSFQNLKDVVDNSKPKPNPNPKPIPKPKSKPPKKVDPFSQRVKRSDSNRVKRTVSAPMAKGDPFFPSVTELQVGHPSRNVVEIIFHTRWGPKVFSGRVEMIFKIQNLARTVARFEEYRDSIKSRAGPDCGSGRCVADGNEMMRFHCLGPTTVIDGCDDLGDFNGGRSAATSICTYSGSGAAHESAGGGFGRRAMVVCRVIAGRVSKRVGVGLDSVNGSGELVDYDSASGENGELLVFDSRAVLPCFLVIYKL